MSALSRNGTAAPQAGPRFAELLQRGQATHGVLASAAPAAPAPPAPPAEGSQRPPADPEDEAPKRPALAVGLRASLGKAGARPVASPREQAATVAPPLATTAAAAPGQATIELASIEPGPAPRQAEGQALPAPVAAPIPVAPTSLVDWLTGMKGPDATAGRPDGADTSVTTAGADRPVARFGGAPGGRSPLDPRTEDARQPDLASGSLLARPTDAAEWLAPAAAALAEMRTLRTEARLASDPLAGPFAGAIGTLTRGADQPTPAIVTVATPVDSPSFAQALGAQVSVLARDGVQRAELHLNPAELGPISVRIEIVGQEARVDFGADMLATRDIIEGGLPELASALREQGITLAGGGVSQHAPDSRQPQAGPATREPRGAAGGDTAPSRSITLRAPEGMLDLYA